MTFRNAEESHKHSLEILNTLYEYDDFMSSVGSVIDLGCGDGLDLLWWATRTTRDDPPEPLNIRCTGVDNNPDLRVGKLHSNIKFQSVNFESQDWHTKKTMYDVLWCHDSFQYVLNPLETLKAWRNIANDNSMLAISLKDTVSITQRRLSVVQPSGCFYHHSIVSLIHMLAVNGWDCADGFFQKKTADSWINVVVYKSSHEPMDPATTTWYELAEKKLLPMSAVESVERHGYVKQEELVLPWLDKSFTWLAQQ